MPRISVTFRKVFSGGYLSIQTFLDSFNVTTGAIGSTIVRTGYGFQPKAFIIWCSGRTEAVDTVGAFSQAMALGFGTSTTQRVSVGVHSEDNAAAGDADTETTVVACLVVAATAGAVDGLLDISTIDADGITFIIDDQFTKNVRVFVLAFGGDSISNAKAGNFVKNADALNQTVTDPGFQPTIVFFVTGRAAAGGTASMLTIGAAISSAKQGVLCSAAADGDATMETKRYCNDIECIARFSAGVTSITHRATFVQMEATGFTIDNIESPETLTVGYLAIAGGDWDMGNLLTRTDGNDIVVSGLAFQPNGLFFFSHGTAESVADTPQDHDMKSVGAAVSPTSRGSQAMSDQDALADSEVAAGIMFDAVYHRLDFADGTAGIMDLKSIETTGFTTVMDDLDPDAAFVLWVACGNVAAAAATDPALLHYNLSNQLRRHRVEMVPM